MGQGWVNMVWPLTSPTCPKHIIRVGKIVVTRSWSLWSVDILSFCWTYYSLYYCWHTIQSTASSSVNHYSNINDLLRRSGLVRTIMIESAYAVDVWLIYIIITQYIHSMSADLLLLSSIASRSVAMAFSRNVCTLHWDWAMNRISYWGGQTQAFVECLQTRLRLPRGVTWRH